MEIIKRIKQKTELVFTNKENKRRLLIAFNTIFILSIVLTPLLLTNNKVKSATYTWNQYDWSDGANTSAYATHTNQMQNADPWKKYYSKNDIVVGTSPNELNLATTNVLKFSKKYEFEKTGHIYNDTNWDLPDNNVQLTQQGKIKSNGYYESPILQGFNSNIDWSEIRWNEKLNKLASFKGFIDGNTKGINGIVPVDLDEDSDVDFAVIGEDPNSMVGWYKNKGNEEFDLIKIDSYDIDPGSYLRGGYRLKVLDFDKDGDLDIVASGYLSSKMRWYKNDGNESFTRIDLITGISNVKGFDIFDFNADNNYDIVAALEGSDDIVLWLNDGAMNFPDTFPEKRYVETNLDGANDVAVGFIDSDSYPDIVASGYYEDKIKYYKNNSNNFFSIDIIDNSIDGPYQIQVIDLDKDGDKDIVAASELGDEIISYDSTGGSDPTFTKDILTTGCDGVRSFHINDLDFDTDLDIAISSYNSGEISYLENTGSTYSKHVITNNYKFGTFIYAADIDKDGDIDISGSTNNGSAVWWENDFGSFKNVFNPVSDPEEIYAGASDAYAIDVDNDSDLDVAAVASTDNELSLWINDGDGNFTKNVISTTIENAQTVFAADLDGINGPDIISADFNANKIIWWENDGTGDFTQIGAEHVITSSYAGPGDVEAGDFNKDGHIDLVSAATNGGSIDWWENDGNASPTFTRKDIDSSESRTFNLASSSVVADIDNDSDQDIIGTAKSDDTVVLWVNNGADPPVFTAEVIDNSFDGAFDTDVFDIDGDGNKDIIGVATEANILAWWQNDGSNNFSTRKVIDSSLNKAFNVDSADIDEDGDGDIVAISPTEGNIFWYENIGSSTFSKHLIRADSQGASSVFIADIDGDENLDILASIRNNSTVEWYKNKQTFSDIKVQVRAGNNPSNLGNYKGPSGLEGNCSLTDVSLAYCFTNSNGGDVSFLPNSEYFQFKVFFTTTGSTISSELNSFEIEATNAIGYVLSGDMVTSPYNSEDQANAMADLSWDDGTGVPSGTLIKAQIRTAPDDGNGNPATWTAWKGPTDQNDYYINKSGNLILDEFSDSGQGTPEDQWFQINFILESNIITTPTLTGTHVKYVINDPPVISIQNTVAEDSSGAVNIDYEITDPDVSGDPLNDDLNSDVYLFVDIGVRLAENLAKTDNTDISINGLNIDLITTPGVVMIEKEIIEYDSKSGGMLTQLSGLTRAGPSTGYRSSAASHSLGQIVWVKVENATGDLGRVINNPGNPDTKHIVWPIASDFDNFYKSDCKIRLVGIDKNAAKQVGFQEISPIILDTRKPLYNLISINSRSDEINLNITDDSAISMRLSNILSTDPTPIPIADGDNTDSGNWISYVNNKEWVFDDPNNDGIETIYAQFRDVYGNTTDVYTINTPKTPTDILIQDVSNPASSDWRLFVSWSIVPDPVSGFKNYNLYRSQDIDNFETTAVLRTQIDDRFTNYFIDSPLDNTKKYYYRITAADNNDNESNFSVKGTGIDEKQLSSDLGLIPSGSGGGNFNPPVISNYTITNITSSSATINWDTDLLADSLVSYSKDYSYDNYASIPTVVLNHQVVLTNLDEDTTYYFKLRSRTPIGEQSELENPTLLTFKTTTDSDPPVISNVIELFNTDSVVITWSTNEPATSQVEYGLTNAYGSSTTEDTNLTLGHSVQIINLTSSTPYFYKILSKDSNTNLAEHEDTFTTAADTNDVTPPVVSNVNISNITVSSVDLTWQTDEDSLSWVEYGPGRTITMGEIIDTGSYKTDFAITLSNLKEEMTYAYIIESVDKHGNRSSTIWSTIATISDTPVISDISIFTTMSSAAIVWSTNEPASGKIDYGETISYGSSSSIDSVMKYSHLIEINGLIQNTLYHYKITSADALGHSTSTTADLTFQTSNNSSDATPPTINNIEVNNITKNSAEVAWDTSEQAISWVSYGTDTNYGSGTINSSSDFKTSFNIVLSSLLSDTTYHYKINAFDSAGNRSSSSDQTFTTLEGTVDGGGFDNTSPKIEGGTSVTNITANEATISWITDKLSSSIILYRIKNSNLDITEVKSGSPNTKEHSITLKNLKPDEVYEYQAKSIAQNSQVSVSEVSEFKTAIKPTIADVTVINKSYGEVTITWATNIDMTGEVRYGLTKGVYSLSAIPNNTYSQLHNTNLSNLSRGGKYYFQVIGRDKYGNISSSDEYSFTTKQPPSITNVLVEQIKDTVVRVKYASSIETVSKVEYKNTTTSEVLVAEKSALVKNHSLDLTNLTPGTKYEMNVYTVDTDKNESKSEPYSFTTLKDIDGPIISGVQTKATILEGKNAKVQAIFSWNTDEESTSEIEFIDKDVDIPESIKKLQSDFVLNHTVVVSTLSPSTVYKFNVSSKDRDGNITKTETYALLTPALRVSVIDLIIKNLEDVFGWTSNI